MRRVLGKIKETTFPTGEVWWSFHCPGCKRGHTITNVWEFDGNYDAPTFNPSVLAWGSPWDEFRCHSFIRAGCIEYLSDCTHELAGQTVELPEWTDKS